jgi:hypothetical protein
VRMRAELVEGNRKRFTADLLVNLARRNQNLIYRQLELLNRLEDHERDAEQLSHLFQLDHLATRIRRNAESLLVLSGEEPARKWGGSVLLVDVVRAAIAEIEELDRVDFSVDEALQVSGRAVADATHLLAELIENAVHFSPPGLSVMVRTRPYLPAPGSHVLTIEDWGVGMTPGDLADANDLLRRPREVDLASAQRLGLHVVARLAGRYGIRTSLELTPGGGVTAVVMLPAELFAVSAAEESRTPVGAGVGERRPYAGDAPARRTPPGALAGPGVLAPGGHGAGSASAGLNGAGPNGAGPNGAGLSGLGAGVNGTVPNGTGVNGAGPNGTGVNGIGPNGATGLLDGPGGTFEGPHGGATAAGSFDGPAGGGLQARNPGASLTGPPEQTRPADPEVLLGDDLDELGSGVGYFGRGGAPDALPAPRIDQADMPAPAARPAGRQSDSWENWWPLPAGALEAPVADGGGLTRRTPQANLADELRRGEEDAPPAPVRPRRDPAETRSALSRFQATQRAAREGRHPRTGREDTP